MSLTAACLGLALAGFSPFGIPDIGNIELTLRLNFFLRRADLRREGDVHK